MRKRLKRQFHDAGLWSRLAQIIKVEEPILFGKIRKWTSDVPISDLDFTLSEMENAGRIAVEREWKDGRLKLSYSYK